MSTILHVNRLSVTINPTKMATINTALSTLEAHLDFLIGLTPKERQGLPKIGAANRPFIEDVAAFVDSGSDYFPKHIASVEFSKDHVLYDQLDSFSARLEKLSRMVQDTQMLAGHEALSAGLRYYEGARGAEEDGDRGASAIVARLAPRFDGQGNFKEVPADDAGDATVA
jgi:hypothetical protein